jgi:hypothetical protein
MKGERQFVKWDSTAGTYMGVFGVILRRGLWQGATADSKFCKEGMSKNHW